MVDTDSDRDSVMTDPNSDEYDSEVELEIATAYIQLCIEYVQKYYMKRPMCTSILSGRSYVIEVLEGNPQVCYNIFRMDKTIFRHLYNELKRLHLLEKDTGIVSVDEVIRTMLFIVGHNADYQLTANCFQHSFETIQRLFLRALRAIHALGCLIIRPDVDAAELPHSLRGNEKYHPWFEMVIERCFGVLKARFPILTEMHSFSLSRQRLIVTTCYALHNFICMYNQADEMFHVWEGSFVRNSNATLAGAAHVGSGGTEEAFNSWA
nr:hypothetical protein CFP56_40384 [Quercus suber]